MVPDGIEMPFGSAMVAVIVESVPNVTDMFGTAIW
jgi:hypothetical protein